MTVDIFNHHHDLVNKFQRDTVFSESPLCSKTCASISRQFIAYFTRVSLRLIFQWKIVFHFKPMNRTQFETFDELDIWLSVMCWCEPVDFFPFTPYCSLWTFVVSYISMGLVSLTSSSRLILVSWKLWAQNLQTSMVACIVCSLITSRELDDLIYTSTTDRTPFETAY